MRLGREGPELKGIPGTTPLVAIALIEIAVSNVWKAETDPHIVTGNVSIVSVNACRQRNTHAAAACEDDAEGLQNPSGPHHPRQPQEQDDSEDVLKAREVNAHERPHLRRLKQRQSIRLEFCLSYCMLMSTFIFCIKNVK